MTALISKKQFKNIEKQLREKRIASQIRLTFVRQGVEAVLNDVIHAHALHLELLLGRNGPTTVK